MKTLAACLSVVLLLPAAGRADDPKEAHPLKLLKPGKTLVNDAFDRQGQTGRRLTRGPWLVKGGVAAVTQDDELYKKYKEHGPALWYDHDFKDAIIRVEFKASAATQRVVFTVNGKNGHVFRIGMLETGTDVRAWSPDHQPKKVAQGPVLPKEKWISLTVELAGERAAVQIDDFFQAAVAEPTYAVDKTVVGLSHAYGSLQVRRFQVIQGVPR